MDGLLHIVTMLWIDILKYYGPLLDTSVLQYNHTNDYFQKLYVFRWKERIQLHYDSLSIDNNHNIIKNWSKIKTHWNYQLSNKKIIMTGKHIIGHINTY